MDLSRFKQGRLFGADRMLDGFLREEDICSTIKKHIIPLIQLEDFEGMYREGGRPPVSPKILLTVLIMQFLERLSDRAAAQSLRYRIDWKIALGLELDFEGIHPTTLVKFRDRLLENDQASYAFDQIVAYLVEQGYIKKSGKQRIDSTHIVGKIRELGRLELFHETLRLFCRATVEHVDDMPEIILDLHQYYSESISIRGISEAQKKKFQAEAGLAMRTFINWCRHMGHNLTDTPAFNKLGLVFEQNFQDKNPNEHAPILEKIATGKGHVCSPHEPEAEFSNKGGKKWLGYKAQVAETVSTEREDVNFITFAEARDATEFDGKIMSSFLAKQEEQKSVPSEVYGDTHYNTEENIKDASASGVDMLGPVIPKPKARNEENKGFEFDQEKNEATCPNGRKSERASKSGSNRVKLHFSKEECDFCPLRNMCKPGKSGKKIEFRLESEILRNRREEMKKDSFKQEMYNRNGIEGTISGLVRGQALRKSRYRGKSKVNLQIKFSAAAANVCRLHRKINTYSDTELKRAG